MERLVLSGVVEERGVGVHCLMGGEKGRGGRCLMDIEFLQMLRVFWIWMVMVVAQPCSG